jgi:methyl-accepting chemotaxis protein
MILLAAMGVVLTLAALAVTITRSYQFDYAAKQAEIVHEDEEGVSITKYFVQQAQSGAMTLQDAQARAKQAIGAIRFEGTNYVAILGFDGFSIVNANKKLMGHNISGLVDPLGHPITAAQLAIAESGTPGFVYFNFKKIGETQLKTKMSYNYGIPEWQWDITTGDFVDDLNASIKHDIIVMAELFVPLFLAYLALVYILCSGLSKLLGGMSRSMRQLAAGDADAEIIGAERRDEIGEMAKTLVVFGQALTDKAKYEKDAEEQRRLNDAARNRVIAETEAQAAQQALVVESIGTGLTALANGDLMFRLNTAFSAAYEKLRSDFNEAMGKLQETIQGIGDTASAVRAGAEEITRASDDLSRRTERQAASLEETAAALDQITATVRKTAEAANEARDLVNTAKADAGRSSGVVSEAVAAMTGIEKASKQIGNIIGVIDEIAFQTNLLALNAGVEAARAGDAGRGFAVVATEVRALAQRSADASKEIKTLISASGAQVTNGVALVGETGKALKRTLEQVEQINHLVGEIAASAKEQATGLNEVNTAVNQMDQVTQQNAAMVEESTAASHSLAGDAEELARLVGQFQTGQAGPAAASPPARSALPARSRITVHAPLSKKLIATKPVLSSVP